MQSWVDAILRWRSGKAESSLCPADEPDARDECCAVSSTGDAGLRVKGGRAVFESMQVPELYNGAALLRRTVMRG